MGVHSFGNGPADVVTNAAGDAIAGRSLTVWTTRSRTTQVTALFELDGSTALPGEVKSDANGRYAFTASDVYQSLWLWDGDPNRDPWQVIAHELVEQATTAIDKADQALADASSAVATADAASTTASAAKTRAQDALDGAAVAQRTALEAVSGQASRLSPASTLAVGPSRILPGVDERYSAFPSLCRTTDGRIIMVWYEATDHLTTRDGNIMQSYSQDSGKTWSTATAAVDDATDVRDPVVRQIGGNLYLTYCRGSASQAWEGSLLRVSYDNGDTWGPEVRIDGGQEYASITAPLVDLGDGVLLAVWNAKQLLSDSYSSAWIATSTDEGATWSAPQKVVDGVALGFDVLEPWVSKRGDTLVMTYRVNAYQDLGRVVSTDNGATWSAHSTILSGATGRPSTTYLADGTLVLAHRNKVSNGADSGLIRFSVDDGATWSPAKVIEQAEPTFWVYSDFLELHDGLLLVASATENSSTRARLSLRYVTMGSAITPFGDVLTDRVSAIVEDRKNLAVADDFDRPDGPVLGFAATGQEWAVTDARLRLASGSIYLGNDGSSGFRYATIDPRCAAVDVEGDFRWSGNAGHGIIFRYVDASNHWFFTVETNGTVVRLYERAGGTATQRGTFGVGVPEGYWHRLRVLDLGGVIRCYIDDLYAIGYASAATTAKRVGVQTSNGAGATHQCRRFLVHRRDRPV